MSNAMYERCEESTQGLEIQLSDSSHLFRHASEITKETKGGYLQGKVYLPKQITETVKDGDNKSNYFLRISLGPADIDPASNPLHIHPLLLYLNTRQNRKKRQSKDGEVPEDVDWCFVLHVNGSDGAVHKVNYKTMVESKNRFNHNRTGRYTGAKRGSEINLSRNYGNDRPKITERHSPNLPSPVNSTQPVNTSKSLDTLKRIENDIINIDSNKICDSDQPRSKITMKETQLLEEYRERLLTSDKRPFNQGPLILPDGWSLSAKLATLKDSDKIETGGESNKMIELGSNGVMLNVITPLQKFTKGGITLVDVLWQRFSDMYQLEASPKLLAETEDIFTGKREDRVKLQMVRLMVEVFHAPQEIPSALSSIPPAVTISQTGENFINSTVSEIITNSKSKECGPLRLHDVNPACSCTRGNTKIFLLSFFKLVSDIRAMFIVWDPEKEEIINNNPTILRGLKQPTDSTVFNQCVLIFTAPPQDPNLLRDEIISKGYELRITAWRPSDGRLSHTSFEFKYFLHGTGNCSEKTQRILCIPPESTEELSTEKESSKNSSFPFASPLVSIEKSSQSSINNDSCLMCDLLEFKTEKDNRHNLPLAKPGIQRRADENIMKSADDRVPIIQLPDNHIPQSTQEVPLNECAPQRKTTASKSSVPIPIAITGGFSTTVASDMNPIGTKPNVTVMGGNSSTHRQLVIGDKAQNSPPIDMSFSKSFPSDSLVPNNKISVTPMVPGALRWKNAGDSYPSKTYFSSKNSSCGTVRLVKDAPHCQSTKLNENIGEKDINRKEANVEIKIDVLGDSILDGEKILSSFKNMKKAEASKQGIKLKRLEDLLKTPTVSNNIQSQDGEQDTPLNLASNSKHMTEFTNKTSESTKSPIIHQNMDKGSLFKTVSINNRFSPKTTTSNCDTKKTTSLNHSSFSFVSSENPSLSTSKTPIEIPLSQEMKIQNSSSPIPSLNIQIRGDELFKSNKTIDQPTSALKESALKLQFDNGQKPQLSIASNLPKFDLIRENSNPKDSEKSFEDNRDTANSESLTMTIPGIPTMVLDSFDEPPLNLRSSRQNNKARNEPNILSARSVTETERLFSQPVYTEPPLTTNVVDVNKGTLTIKLESEDIIAAQPGAPNVDEDRKEGITLNGILCHDNQDNHSSTQGLNGSMASVNKTIRQNQYQKASALSFQDSRTPFSKRLEMLRQGISSKAPIISPVTSAEVAKPGSPESFKDSNDGKGNKSKRQERKTNRKSRDVAEEGKESAPVGKDAGVNNVIIQKNGDPASDEEKNNYLGKRLYIAEESHIENETNSNKRKRLSSSDNSSGTYSTFIPIGPIPTILNQSSEDEKSNAKSKTSNRPIRKTRGKRKPVK